MVTSREHIYPLEYAIPDISIYKESNTGVDYIHRVDTGIPGPTVMINALTHGNEFCGAVAVDYLLKNKIKPSKGTLYLGFLNVDAFFNFNKDDPHANRYVDQDINRVWDIGLLDSDKDSSELRRARIVRPIIDKLDYLLDIHSMLHPKTPMMVPGNLKKSIDLAKAVGYPDTITTDLGHKAGVRLRDYSFFGIPDDPRNCVTVECGQHWQKSTVDTAMQMAFRFLLQFDLITPDEAKKHIPFIDKVEQKVVHVTASASAQSTDFDFVEKFVGMEIIPGKGTIIGHDKGEPVRTPFDNAVLIMPTLPRFAGDTIVRFGQYES